mgnify:CR=1 FL=1
MNLRVLLELDNTIDAATGLTSAHFFSSYLITR